MEARATLYSSDALCSGDHCKLHNKPDAGTTSFTDISCDSFALSVGRIDDTKL